MKTEKGIKTKIIILLIATITVISIGIKVEETDSFLDSFNKFQVLDIAYIALYYILLEKIIEIKDKRAKICCSILAIIFGLFEVIGYSISKYYDVSCVIGSIKIFIKAILKLFGYFVTFYSILLLLFVKGIPKIKELKNKEYKFFTNNKRSLIIICLIIFLCYIPYFLSEYPGIITTDSVTEIYLSLHHEESITNHHPITHIGIIMFFIKIGEVLNNYNIGIALYSLFQMICTAFVFSFTLYYMAKRNVNFYIRALCLVVFALYPPFAYFSVVMWKDIPFALSMILYTICMIELATNKNFISRLINKIFLFITMLLVILFRNNGIYVVLLSIPFMIFFLKGKRKALSIISIIIVVFYIIFKGPIFKIFHVYDSPIREALSVPLQQIARAVRYRGSEITDEEKEQINRFMPVDEIGNLYYPLISDSVKDTLNNEEVEENKMDFISIWLKLLIKFPREYVESFLCGSLGYWYPEEKNWVIPNEDEINYETCVRECKIDIEKSPIIKTELADKIATVVNQRYFPIISGVFSIGFMVWCTATMLMYVIYKKKYKLILAYIPMIGLWITTIASPVWCEYRYIYSIFTCAPLLVISIVNFIDQEQQKERNENA